MWKVNIMKFLRILSRRSRDISSAILLVVSYAVGIGFSSIAGKLAGKQFLNLSPKKSTWVAHHNESPWEHMY
jgi:dolichol kinase